MAIKYPIETAADYCEHLRAFFLDDYIGQDLLDACARERRWDAIELQFRLGIPFPGDTPGIAVDVLACSPNRLSL